MFLLCVYCLNVCVSVLEGARRFRFQSKRFFVLIVPSWAILVPIFDSSLREGAELHKQKIPTGFLWAVWEGSRDLIVVCVCAADSGFLKRLILRDCSVSDIGEGRTANRQAFVPLAIV